jgi:hypothetical protein
MKKTKSHNKAIGIGAGAFAAALAVAAGTYLLSGEKGKARRAKVKAWAVKARKEVARNVKTAKHLGEGEYKVLVQKAMQHYGQLENMTGAEIALAARDLMSEWKAINARAKKIVRTKNANPVKKTTKKTTRTAKRR